MLIEIDGQTYWANTDEYKHNSKIKAIQLILNGDYKSINFEALKNKIDEKQYDIKNYVVKELWIDDASPSSVAYGYWEFLFYYVVTNIDSGKTWYVLSSETADAFLSIEMGYGYKRVIEAKSGMSGSEIIDLISDNQNLASGVANTIVKDQTLTGKLANSIASNQALVDSISTKADFKEAITNSVASSIINSNEFLEQIAIKVIEYMHLNGVDFTYAPTLAKVTLIHENGVVENVDLMEKENGIWQGSTTLNGAFTIQISPKGGLL